jgi:hypothetical protein
MYDNFIYSSDPATEELTIERNGDEDYLRELAAEHDDPWADYEDYTDEEFAKEMAEAELAKEIDAQETYDAAVFELAGDIEF